MEFIACDVKPSHLGIGHDGQALLQLHRDGDDRVSSGVCLDPLSNFGKMLVLLADVVLLAQVDEVDDRLGRKEEERVDGLDLMEWSARSSKMLSI